MGDYAKGARTVESRWQMERQKDKRPQPAGGESMGIKMFVGDREVDAEQSAVEYAAMSDVGNELYALDRCKEILTALEKQGRITSGLREAGIIALSGAIMSLEHPYMRALGHQAGLRASTEQWEKQQRAKKHEF